MEKIKISFIATVFNEQENISKLLSSLLSQSILPAEVIIVDGGSTDRTKSIIQEHSKKFKNKLIDFKFFVKKGNRSVGRNEAIRKAKYSIIACSDSGCILDQHWLKNITSPFEMPAVDVVAGYTEGEAENIFQKCLIPYVLVMSDRIDPDTFLPATRSMAIKKNIWKEVGGFDENLSDNEDYAFSKKLKKHKVNILFQKYAIAYWIPRRRLDQVFNMFYRFAKGDITARILRPKALLIVFRYLIGILLLFLAIIYKDKGIILIIFTLFEFYLIWSIIKNYRYVNDLRAIILLPLFQLVSDIAVLAGTFAGLYKIWDIKKM